MNSDNKYKEYNFECFLDEIILQIDYFKIKDNKEFKKELINHYNNLIENKAKEFDCKKDENNFLLHLYIPDEDKEEPDNSKITKEFYKEYFKDFYNEDEFIGDTIVSFRTMAGCTIRCLNIKDNMPISHVGRLEYILKNENLSDDFKHKFIELLFLIYTKANFMPLPKGNLNLSKGNVHTYHDFPDAFFMEIKNYVSLFMDKNQALLWWTNFVEKNYLQSLFIDNNYDIFKKIKPKEKMPYSKPKEDIDKTKQKGIISGIEEFLNNAIDFIIERNFYLKGCKK